MLQKALSIPLKILDMESVCLIEVPNVGIALILFLHVY